MARLLMVAVLVCIVCGGPPHVFSQSSSLTRPPVLILIHGRDQPLGERARVERDWEEAIDSGLAMAGVPGLIPRDSRRFFWYADAVAGRNSCNFFAMTAPENDGMDFWPVLRDLFLRIASQMPNAAEREIVRWRMDDTERYLSDPTVSCRVHDDLLDLLIESAQLNVPLIIVGHSMGSMIIYKQLMTMSDSRSVYLVTIGSMLGERSVLRTLLGSHAGYPGVVPRPVVWWRNVINRGDLLAFEAARAFSSQFPGKRPKDVIIDVRTGPRHNASTYLSSPKVGRLLLEAWCAAWKSDASRTSRPGECSQ